MASYSGSGYGVTNPAGLDPYPIESTLAQMAYGNSPAQAQTALDTYWLQNKVDKDNYGYDLQQQHEAFKQQLANQMAEANLKAVGEAKDPNVLQILAGSSYRNQIFPGMSDAQVADLVQRARLGQDATNVEHGASGFKSASDAGVQLPTNYLSRLGNFGPLQQGERPDITKEKIAAGGRIAAAQAGAPQLTGDTSVDLNTPGGKIHQTWHYDPAHADQAYKLAVQAQDAARQASENPSVSDGTMPAQPSIGKKSGREQPQTSTPNTAAVGSRIPANTTMAQRDTGPTEINTRNPAFVQARGKAEQVLQQYQASGDPAKIQAANNMRGPSGYKIVQQGGRRALFGANNSVIPLD